MNSMTQHAFVNRLRSLFNIDWDRLPELPAAQWPSFRDNPVGFLLRSSDAQADAIWREIEKMQPSELIDDTALEARKAGMLAARKPAQDYVDAFYSDHSSQDPSTGTYEFGNQGLEEDAGIMWEMLNAIDVRIKAEFPEIRI